MFLFLVRGEKYHIGKSETTFSKLYQFHEVDINDQLLINRPTS